MKILTLHCDYIKFQPLKKALKDASELSASEKKSHTVKECLVVLTAVEKGDSDKELNEMLEAVKKTAGEVKTNSIVLYPYAHLSSNLSAPQLALEILQKAESMLSKDFKVTRAPFGYYKSFELRCKGHPLSELSKTFGSQAVSASGKVAINEEYDTSRLLNELSRSKLDTSKLKDNDHRILGQRLDLFSFNEAAPGQPFWHHHGLIIYNELVSFLRKLLSEFDYQEISTPQVMDNRLWKVSGHWAHYKDNMFITEHEKRDFGVKPMNCPGAMLTFRASPRSYKELPLRFAEFGIVHRRELSGVLAGLFRVIKFTQDDAHIFCTKEQIGKEISSLLEIVKIIYSTFKFEYSFELSTRPEKFLGEQKDWDYAEKALETELKQAKIKYETKKGEGAFYGPKIDIHIKDSLGRSWQCATIQLDMQMPQRFQLSYTGEDNKDYQPVIIHRVILGSVERFIGVLLEHLNGALPLWLSPRQVRIINFTDRNTKACEKLLKELKEAMPELRIDSDLRNDTVQSKVRDAELLKINYTIVIGDKEEAGKTLAVRPRGGKPKFGVKLNSFIEDLRKELVQRA
ncbi:MAG: threonine--tRNA ligase [Nanoarchaeota archaeon]